MYKDHSISSIYAVNFAISISKIFINIFAFMFLFLKKALKKYFFVYFLRAYFKQMQSDWLLEQEKFPNRPATAGGIRYVERISGNRQSVTFTIDDYSKQVHVYSLYNEIVSKFN